MVYLIIGIIFAIGVIISWILFQWDPFFAIWRKRIVMWSAIICVVAMIGFLIATAVLQSQATKEIDNLKYEIMITTNNLLQAESEEEYKDYCLKAKEINEHLVYLKLEAKDWTSKYSLRNVVIDFLQPIKYKGAEI